MPATRTLRQRVSHLVPQSVRFNARKLVHRGTALQCPLCGCGVDRFEAHGGGADVLDRRKVVGGMRRENDSCPVCHGADRTRLMMLFLKGVLPESDQPRSVLHIAPDLGLYLWLKRQPRIDYVAADMDLSRYRHIENVVQADLTKLPLESGRFDIVICSHVLEHIPDDHKAMTEIARVLKPGGVAVLMVPLATDGLGTDENPAITSAQDRVREFGQWDHVRLYGRDDFARRLSEAGFSVSWFNGFETQPLEAERLKLNPLENIAIARKP